MRSRKAFTLIELLVVVAIIGILAAMILVALNQARLKARDGRVKGALAQMRAQAEVLYDTNSNYNGTCSADSTMDSLEADIDRNNGTAGGVPTCTDSDSTFQIVAVLATGGSMCINQTGQTWNNATCSGTPI